jgi:hypothetical protein
MREYERERESVCMCVCVCVCEKREGRNAQPTQASRIPADPCERCLWLLTSFSFHHIHGFPVFSHRGACMMWEGV